MITKEKLKTLFYTVCITMLIIGCSSESNSDEIEGEESNTMEISHSGAQNNSTLTDSSTLTNQSGSTGNGGVGTGTINSTSEKATLADSAAK